MKWSNPSCQLRLALTLVRTYCDLPNTHEWQIPDGVSEKRCPLIVSSSLLPRRELNSLRDNLKSRINQNTVGEEDRAPTRANMADGDKVGRTKHNTPSAHPDQPTVCELSQRCVFANLRHRHAAGVHTQPRWNRFLVWLPRDNSAYDAPWSIGAQDHIRMEDLTGLEPHAGSQRAGARPGDRGACVILGRSFRRRIH